MKAYVEQAALSKLSNLKMQFPVNNDALPNKVVKKKLIIVKSCV